MASQAPAIDPTDQLDIIGQFPSLRIYTQIVFCYPVTDDSVYEPFISTLRTGLERLTAGFPWVAGQVINEGAGNGSSGIFKFAPFEAVPRLVVKDLRSNPSAPTWAELEAAGFPFSKLDENVIAPRNTLPGRGLPVKSGDVAAEASPVILLQANFVQGGLLLTINGEHNAMDMNGQGVIMDLLDKACRGEPFTAEEIQVGNLRRADLIPLLNDSYVPDEDVAHQIVKPPAQATIKNVQQPPPTGPDGLPPPPAAVSSTASWNYWTFSAASLAQLKRLATETANLPPGGFISTDDALTALTWQAASRARRIHLPASAETRLARAIDVRRILGVPAKHTGMVQNMTYHRFPLAEISSPNFGLGKVAAELRRGIDPERIAHETRALATYTSRTPDKGKINMIASVDVKSGLMLSSWAKTDCYGLGFGLRLGKGEEGYARPVAVRRPCFTPVEGLGYIMPKRPDGQLVLGVCLKDDDVARMREDEVFSRFGVWIG